ncbi:hypothetical protein N7481_003720 [Penicillium waksmanii]|uniref:uncharacterized protein n=1 Tax=Penicillium waksmanii TaxID=69791 RepID=UPI002549962B|nr:uncharacterized protein N7481_003720 [Penicillium waksmanii]KAJ5988510.1 hypothetical protein N7481_003720 [Penicillium waksmanii]
MNRQREAEKALHDQTNILPFAQLMVVFTGLATSLLIMCMDQNGISVTLPTIARDLGRPGHYFLGGNLLIDREYHVHGPIWPAVGYFWTQGCLHIGASVAVHSRFVVWLIAKPSHVLHVVTLEQRGKYQGILGASLGVGNIMGPFIAAAFIERSTWRGFFWLISPLAAISAIVGYFLIPNNAKKGDFRQNLYRIDWFGVLASSIGIIFVLIPVSGGGSYFPWDSPMVIAMLVIGGCAFVAFAFIEWKVATLPMLPVVFFKSKVITALFLQSFLLGAVYQAYLYYLPLYYQNARGWSPIVSAALTSPMVACQAIASICSGQYISRLKRYGEIIWMGFGLWTLGAGLMLRFDDKTHPAVIAVCVGITGIGIGFTFQPTLVALQAHCTKSHRAISISNRNFFRCMGGACGLAISAAILQATLRSQLPAEFSYLTESTYSLPSRSSLTDTQWAQILLAYSKASHSVFILQVPLIGVCFLACAFIRDRGLERVKSPEEIEEEKRKVEAERDAEASLTDQQPKGNEVHQGEEVMTRQNSMTSAADSHTLHPSRAESLAGRDEKINPDQN